VKITLRITIEKRLKGDREVFKTYRNMNFWLERYSESNIALACPFAVVYVTGFVKMLPPLVTIFLAREYQGYVADYSHDHIIPYYMGLN